MSLSNKISRMKFTALLIKIKLIYKLRSFYRGFILKKQIQCFNFYKYSLTRQYMQEISNRNIRFIESLAFVVSLKIFQNGHITDKYKTFYEENKDLVEIKTEEANQSKDLKEIISLYYLLNSYYWKCTNSDQFIDKMNESFAEARKLSQNEIIELDNKEFDKLSRRLKNSLKNEKKLFKKEVKYFIKCDFQENLPKIKIKSSSLQLILTIITPLFFISGFIYNKYLLGSFNIEVSSFFTLSDYLSTSIDSLYLIGISSLIGVLFYLFGAFVGLRQLHFESQLNLGSSLFRVGNGIKAVFHNLGV